MPIMLSILMAISFAGEKIAVTAAGSTPESEVGSRFGRSSWYMIYDPAEGTWQAAENSDIGSTGAGRDAAASLERRGVTVVITGRCGPNALDALHSAGIKVYHASDCTVAEALRDFEAGRLKQIK